MTDTTTETKPHSVSRSRRMVAALAVVLLIIVGILAWASFRRNPVTGHLRLGTALGEGELEVFVGNRLVGRHQAEVQWSDIFGWTGQQSLGILLPDDAAEVDCDATDGDLGEITAERLAGRGATIVHASDGSPVWLSYPGGHEFSKKEILLRRPDGSLDHIFCLDGRLNDLFGNPHRVIVPIRVRTRRGTPDAYFTTEHRSTAGGRFDNVLHRVCPEWNFERTAPPPDFAEEVNEHGLWRPSN